jgi:hypothetical protein
MRGAQSQIEGAWSELTGFVMRAIRARPLESVELRLFSTAALACSRSGKGRTDWCYCAFFWNLAFAS